MKATLVSKSEYAKRRGCAPSAVTRAIKEGRIVPLIVDGRELIDPAVADIQWAQNTRARSDSSPATAAVRSSEAHSSAAFDSDDDDAGDIRVVRARRELAEAKLAEYKLAELRGDLVRAADVRAAWARRAAGLREALLQIPARLAAVLAAEADQSKCFEAVRAELHQVLASVTQE